MEELRSTDILDKEIQEDARKKAEKIVKNSQIESQNILDGVDSKLKTAREEKEKFYAEKIARFEKDTNAALPLEKQRFLVSFEDEQVTQGIKKYLEKLSIEKKAELLKSLLQKYKPTLENHKVYVFTVDFEKKLAEKIVEDILGSKNIISCNELSDFEKQQLLMDQLTEMQKSALLVVLGVFVTTLIKENTYQREYADSLLNHRIKMLGLTYESAVKNVDSSDKIHDVLITIGNRHNNKIIIIFFIFFNILF